MQGEKCSTNVKMFDVQKFLQICLAVSSNFTLIICQCEQIFWLCLQADSGLSQKVQQCLEETALKWCLTVVLYYTSLP